MFDLWPPKDPVEYDELLGVVYKVPCSDCDRTYIGQTGNSLRTRLQQHRAACRHLQREKSALAEHSIDSDHRINWAEAKVVSRQERWHRRLFEEAFVTHQRSHPLNRCELPLPPVYKKLLWPPFDSLHWRCPADSGRKFCIYFFTFKYNDSNNHWNFDHWNRVTCFQIKKTYFDSYKYSQGSPMTPRGKCPPPPLWSGPAVIEAQYTAYIG